MTTEELKPYWTVLVPPEPDPAKRTVWHDAELTLSRGAFPTVEAAAAWAYTHLGSDAEFRLRRYPIEDMV